ncbi:rRNA maturation RNase YbeY [uncultured Nocardioides sp.]|uniref:rRNA maturation RNase YbeY n=1 Tax=uncultured Nocardioides sp. TaxID=198441 RepID=UPI00261BCFB6|nr:rRNA maturation RNase YbeY [uncultured Nocardioides sp.]
MIEATDESGTDLDLDPYVAVAAHAMRWMKVHPEAELSVTAVDEAAMAELNGRWMDKEGPTDVLAFPMDELRPGDGVEGVLGDLVLCPTVAARQAEEAGHPQQAELELLTVHGVLHLLGYDHAEPDEHREMFGLQDEILDAWRNGDPAP